MKRKGKDGQKEIKRESKTDRQGGRQTDGEREREKD